MKKTVLLTAIACLLISAAVPAHAEEVFIFEAVDSGNVYVFDLGAGGESPNLPPYIPEITQPVAPKFPTYDAPKVQQPAPTRSVLPTYTPPKPVRIDTAVYAEEVLKLVNVEREKVGLHALAQDPTLTEMAGVRAKELETLFSHTRPNGSRCSTVLVDFDTSLSYGGENIAAGFKTPAAVVGAWMQSDGHRKNILRSTSNYLGIGVWQDDKGTLYWEQLFAK